LIKCPHAIRIHAAWPLGNRSDELDEDQGGADDACDVRQRADADMSSR
jgi:hypothetical protein